MSDNNKLYLSTCVSVNPDNYLTESVSFYVWANNVKDAEKKMANSFIKKLSKTTFGLLKFVECED